MLLQILTQIEREIAYKYVKQSYSDKHKLHEEFHRKLMQEERERNQQLLSLVASQQRTIAELKEKTEHAVEIERGSYTQPNIKELMAQKNKNEELESELILRERKSSGRSSQNETLERLDSIKSLDDKKRLTQSRNRSSLSIRSSIKGTFFDSHQENVCMTPSFSATNGKTRFKEVNEGSPNKSVERDFKKRMKNSSLGKIHKSSSSLMKRNGETNGTVANNSKELVMKNSLTKSTLATDHSEIKHSGQISAVKFKNFEKLARTNGASPFTRNRTSLSKAISTIGNKSLSKEASGIKRNNSKDLAKSVVKKPASSYKQRRSQVKESKKAQ
eukprot:TRINITY_DN6189_c0_g1_i6.p1 TRINITY_DN6189_c0_g1~~TRINITY_DN6189_c0_g1_i6.p1  ORF type:complete len:330 (+),score=76.81 TRINITY_DN6189_c0_g1_i6:310-1299(+)